MKQMMKWVGCLFWAGLVAAAAAAEDGEDVWGLSGSWFTPTEAEKPAGDDWSFEGDAFGGTGEATPPEGWERGIRNIGDLKPLLEHYTRVRLDATGFANAVARFWFLESQRAGKYFIFCAQTGPELRSELTCVTPDGKEILTVWFPVSPESAQATIDMCNAYNADMVGFALDLARNGDFETALCICRQIRKLNPDMGPCYPWDEMEKDLGNRNADLQYPYTRKDCLPPNLSRAFFEIGGLVGVQ